MRRICLFGASGHGKVVKDVATSKGIEVEAFIDDNPKSKFIHDVVVVSAQEIGKYKELKFLISIGDNSIRKIISKKLKSAYIKLIDNSAIVSPTAKVSEGTVIMSGTRINADTKLGKHSIINTNAVIEHDCIIENFVHISPNATVTGGVIIGEGTHVGAAAVIIPNVKIGKWVTIGAGAVITKDIPDYAVVVGVPGEIIKYNKK